MRILITSSTYAPSLNGQAVFTTNIAEGMACRGHQVCVLTPSARGEPYETERNGVQIHSVRAFGLGMLHDEAYAAVFPDPEVRVIFNTFNPDIVHVQDHHPHSICALKAARRSRKKVIGTNHFMPENLAPYFPLLPILKPVFNYILWRWMKWTFTSLDLVTAPSKTAARIMLDVGVHPPIIPISCGVNLNRFHPDAAVDRQGMRKLYGLHPDRTTFLFVGRVDAEKRVDVLIHALKLLRRNDVQLAIAGHGAAHQTYEKLVYKLGLEDQVRFTGYVPANDLPALLNSVDFFAMPSEAELLSIASLEAMASGLPLLVARSRALPELVQEGINGYLFDPGNVEDACRCMAALVDHPDWQALGAASLKLVQPHGLENVLNRYEDTYIKLQQLV